MWVASSESANFKEKKFFLLKLLTFTAQKVKFSIKDFFSKGDQIWSHLLKKPLIQNFIFCAVFKSKLL